MVGKGVAADISYPSKSFCTANVCALTVVGENGQGVWFRCFGQDIDAIV